MELYVRQGFDITQPVPLSLILMGFAADDVPIIKNVRKLNALAEKRFQRMLVALLIPVRPWIC